MIIFRTFTILFGVAFLLLYDSLLSSFFAGVQILRCPSGFPAESWTLRLGTCRKAYFQSPVVLTSSKIEITWLIVRLLPEPEPQWR